MNRIGIIGAMEEEISRLKENMENVKITSKASMDFYEGTIKGKRAVVVRSGIGKVNAGMCAQILADVFEVDAIINTGIAGSLNNEINIGDIVVSTDVLQHDVDAGVFGYRKGQIPQMPVLSFAADERLRAAAVAACQEVNPEIQVFEGRIASGDQFIAGGERKSFIINNFHPLCVEMEGCAIAHTCFANNIPFVIIRCMSDCADDSAVETYEESKASKASSEFLLDFIKEI